MTKSTCVSCVIAGLAGVIVSLSSCTGNSNPYASGIGTGTTFESGTVAPGGTFVHVFTTAGVVAYHCTFHGAAGGVGMSGTITVQEGGVHSLDTILMNAMTFSPVHDTIDAGDTVKWINISTVNHTATSDN